MWLKDLGGERVCSVLSLLLVGLVFLLSSMNPFLVLSLLKDDPVMLSERD